MHTSADSERHTCAVSQTRTATELIARLDAEADPAEAGFLQRFFKTGPGEYGEGDRFIGVGVPVIRRIIREFTDLPVAEIELALRRPVHEHRLAALLLMVVQYPKSDPTGREALYGLYRRALQAGLINNWDLVDSSAEYIIGPWLADSDRSEFGRLATSESLWDRRVAMMAPFHYLKAGEASTTLVIAEQLLGDDHDLIRKAVGWMLRETGKRVDRQLLLDFLDRRVAAMSATTLSYATEHLDPAARAHYRRLRRGDKHQ